MKKIYTRNSLFVICTSANLPPRRGAESPYNCYTPSRTMGCVNYPCDLFCPDGNPTSGSFVLWDSRKQQLDIRPTQRTLTRFKVGRFESQLVLTSTALYSRCMWLVLALVRLARVSTNAPISFLCFYVVPPHTPVARSPTTYTPCGV